MPKNADGIAEEILRTLDDAGEGIPLAQWTELLETVSYGVRTRLDAAKEDAGRKR